MDELTIVIDSWGHKELKEYLMSLNGISCVSIKEEDQLEIYIKYNSNLINSKIIKFEILVFLNISKVPSILAFDKHPKIKTTDYSINRNKLCCEYCFKGAIDYLYDIEGIEKCDSNFNEDDLFEKYDNNIIINIKYNPNLISFEKMKQIELNLNI